MELEEIEPISPEAAFGDGARMFQGRVNTCVQEFNKRIARSCAKDGVKESDTIMIHYSGGPDMDELDRGVLQKVQELFEYHGWRVERTDGEFWILKSVFVDRKAA
jgi:hypothetical protein